VAVEHPQGGSASLEQVGGDYGPAKLTSST